MLNHAVFCLFALLISLTGCAGAESHIQGRACSVPVTPISTPAPIVIPAVVEPKPIAAPKAPKQKTMILEVTGYSSTTNQTDDTPCIAAHLIDICSRKAAGEKLCATNVFPIGTQISVEGLGICTVADHMAKRKSHHVDWYFTSRKAAKTFGRKNRTVTIVTR